MHTKNEAWSARMLFTPALLLLFMSPAFAQGTTCAFLIGDPTAILLTEDKDTAIITAYLYNDADPDRPGIPNSNIFVSYDTVDANEEREHHLCKIVTGSSGADKGYATFHYDPDRTGCYGYDFTYCPTIAPLPFYNLDAPSEQLGLCLGLGDEAEVAYSSILFCEAGASFTSDPPVTNPNPPPATILAPPQPAGFAASTNSLDICNPKITDAYADVCWPLTIILGMLLGAMFLMGKNPLTMFDMSSPRPSRGKQYQMRQGGASYSLAALAGAIEKTTGDIHTHAKGDRVPKGQPGEGKLVQQGGLLSFGFNWAGRGVGYATRWTGRVTGLGKVVGGIQSITKQAFGGADASGAATKPTTKLGAVGRAVGGGFVKTVVTGVRMAVALGTGIDISGTGKSDKKEGEKKLSDKQKAIAALAKGEEGTQKAVVGVGADGNLALFKGGQQIKGSEGAVTAHGLKAGNAVMVKSSGEIVSDKKGIVVFKNEAALANAVKKAAPPAVQPKGTVAPQPTAGQEQKPGQPPPQTIVRGATGQVAGAMGGSANVLGIFNVIGGLKLTGTPEEKPPEANTAKFMLQLRQGMLSMMMSNIIPGLGSALYGFSMQVNRLQAGEMNNVVKPIANGGTQIKEVKPGEQVSCTDGSAMVVGKKSMFVEFKDGKAVVENGQLKIHEKDQSGMFTLIVNGKEIKTNGQPTAIQVKKGDKLDGTNGNKVTMKQDGWVALDAAGNVIVNAKGEVPMYFSNSSHFNSFMMRGCGQMQEHEQNERKKMAKEDDHANTRKVSDKLIAKIEDKALKNKAEEILAGPGTDDEKLGKILKLTSNITSASIAAKISDPNLRIDAERIAQGAGPEAKKVAATESEKVAAIKKLIGGKNETGAQALIDFRSNSQSMLQDMNSLKRIEQKYGFFLGIIPPLIPILVSEIGGAITGREPFDPVAHNELMYKFLVGEGTNSRPGLITDPTAAAPIKERQKVFLAHGFLADTYGKAAQIFASNAINCLKQDILNSANADMLKKEKERQDAEKKVEQAKAEGKTGAALDFYKEKAHKADEAFQFAKQRVLDLVAFYHGAERHDIMKGPDGNSGIRGTISGMGENKSVEEGTSGLEARQTYIKDVSEAVGAVPTVAPVALATLSSSTFDKIVDLKTAVEPAFYATSGEVKVGSTLSDGKSKVTITELRGNLIVGKDADGNVATYRLDMKKEQLAVTNITVALKGENAAISQQIGQLKGAVENLQKIDNSNLQVQMEITGVKETAPGSNQFQDASGKAVKYFEMGNEITNPATGEKVTIRNDGFVYVDANGAATFDQGKPKMVDVDTAKLSAAIDNHVGDVLNDIYNSSHMGVPAFLSHAVAATSMLDQLESLRELDRKHKELQELTGGGRGGTSEQRAELKDIEQRYKEAKARFDATTSIIGCDAVSATPAIALELSAMARAESIGITVGAALSSSMERFAIGFETSFTKAAETYGNISLLYDKGGMHEKVATEYCGRVSEIIQTVQDQPRFAQLIYNKGERMLYGNSGGAVETQPSVVVGIQTNVSVYDVHQMSDLAPGTPFANTDLVPADQHVTVDSKKDLGNGVFKITLSNNHSYICTQEDYTVTNAQGVKETSHRINMYAEMAVRQSAHDIGGAIDIIVCKDAQGEVQQYRVKDIHEGTVTTTTGEKFCLKPTDAGLGMAQANLINNMDESGNVNAHFLSKYDEYVKVSAEAARQAASMDVFTPDGKVVDPMQLVASSEGVRKTLEDLRRDKEEFWQNVDNYLNAKAPEAKGQAEGDADMQNFHAIPALRIAPENELEQAVHNTHDAIGNAAGLSGIGQSEHYKRFFNPDMTMNDKYQSAFFDDKGKVREQPLLSADDRAAFETLKSEMKEAGVKIVITGGASRDDERTARADTPEYVLNNLNLAAQRAKDVETALRAIWGDAIQIETKAQIWEDGTVARKDTKGKDDYGNRGAIISASIDMPSQDELTSRYASAVLASGEHAAAITSDARTLIGQEAGAYAPDMAKSSQDILKQSMALRQSLNALEDGISSGIYSMKDTDVDNYRQVRAGGAASGYSALEGSASLLSPFENILSTATSIEAANGHLMTAKGYRDAADDVILHGTQYQPGPLSPEAISDHVSTFTSAANENVGYATDILGRIVQPDFSSGGIGYFTNKGTPVTQ